MVSVGISMAYLAFFVSYLLMGGFLFHICECPAEIHHKRQEAALLKEFVTLFSHLEKLEDLRREVVAGKTELMNLISHLEHLREDLRDKLSQPKLTFMLNHGFRLMVTNVTEEEEVVCETWSFYNSIFFAFTSITTIGYGAHVPQTQLGRGLCIIYLIIGIPINSLLVGCIGTNFLNKGRKLFYRNYRGGNKGLYVVARNFFLLLLDCSAWPCLGPAYQNKQTFISPSVQDLPFDG